MLITEDVPCDAAENIFHGEEMMALLLDRGGDRALLFVTEDVLRIADENWLSNRRPVRDLHVFCDYFGRRGDEDVDM